MLISCFGISMIYPKLALKSKTMLNIEQHKEWILKCIQSCNTHEQLGSCRVILSTFVLLMTKDKTDPKIIKEVEDELLLHLLNMDSKIFVP